MGWVSWDSPPGQVAPAAGLEANDDIRDLHAGKQTKDIIVWNDHKKV